MFGRRIVSYICACNSIVVIVRPLLMVSNWSGLEYFLTVKNISSLRCRLMLHAGHYERSSELLKPSSCNSFKRTLTKELDREIFTIIDGTDVSQLGAFLDSSLPIMGRKSCNILWWINCSVKGCFCFIFFFVYSISDIAPWYIIHCSSFSYIIP